MAEKSSSGGVRSPPITRGPSLFSFFIVAKYAGGSGCPARTPRTKVASSLATSAQLILFSYPTVDDGTADIPFPHADPAPCPGQTERWSGNARNFSRLFQRT